MTEVAMSTQDKKLNTIAMVTSFLMGLPLAAVLLIHPSMMLDAGGNYSHRVMMLIMIGILATLFTA